VVVTLAVLLHFALVMTVIAVPSAIPEPAQPAVQRYLVPFFAQDWRLFAPSPDVNDYEVYARASYRVGDRVEWTPWTDLLEPLILAVQANRLSPESVRLETVHKAALLTNRSAGPFGQVSLGREAVADRWERLEWQPASLVVLERMASVVLADAHPERRFESVQVMLTARLVGAADDQDGGSALLFHPVPFQDVTVR
jgi:hypothetical protein